MDVKIDFCEKKAAAFACRRWHYSKTVPCGKMVTFGVWESGRFIGAVIFSRGASAPMYRSMKMEQTELCELARVALSKHDVPVSKVIATCLRKLKECSPGLRAVVSFADDTDQGHLGIVYQAGNWIYLGESTCRHLLVDGVPRHSRINGSKLAKKYPRAKVETREKGVKHKYLYPLDRATRRRWARLSVPYPKKLASSGKVQCGGSTPVGGSTPPRTLQTTKEGTNDGC